MLPTSHLKHREICDLPASKLLEFPGENPNYIEVIDEEIPRRMNFQPKLVKAKAGDLVLWDSRTLHCNVSGTDSDHIDPNRLLRAAIYTCMVPRTFADTACLEQRKQGWKKNRTSSHWPYTPGLHWTDEEDQGADRELLPSAADELHLV